jgi:hypothetical protein
MGAGDYPAGAGPAGSDPIVSTGPAVDKQFPVPLYDLVTKDFPLDAHGEYLATHPVDQAVALALGIQAGKVAGDPALGNTLKAIIKAGGPTLQNNVETRIRTALQTLLNAGDIEIGTIVVETIPLGGFLVAVAYRNLRILSSAQKTARIPLT